MAVAPLLTYYVSQGVSEYDARRSMNNGLIRVGFVLAPEARYDRLSGVRHETMKVVSSSQLTGTRVFLQIPRKPFTSPAI